MQNWLRFLDVVEREADFITWLEAREVDPLGCATGDRDLSRSGNPGDGVSKVKAITASMTRFSAPPVRHIPEICKI